MTAPIIEALALRKDFPRHGTNILAWGRQEPVHAVRDVTLSVGDGEVLGLVGESGSGKTTVGRCIVRLETPTVGEVRFRGHRFGDSTPREFRTLRRHIQMVFQDSFASLNPRLTVWQTLEEPLRLLTDLGQTARRDRIVEILGEVGLSELFLQRYRHQLSGGQQQRVNVARAVVVIPDFLVLDEPVSALDASVKAQVLRLLKRLQARFGLSYLFISHDLQTVNHICDRVAIMYLGGLVETGTVSQIFSSPVHPYTKLLLASMLEPQADAATRLSQSLFDPLANRFEWMHDPRWTLTANGSAPTYPPLVEIESGHYVAMTRS